MYSLREKLIDVDFSFIDKEMNEDENFKNFLMSPLEELPENYRYLLSDKDLEKFKGANLYDFMKFMDYAFDDFKTFLSEDGKVLGWFSYKAYRDRVENIKIFSFHRSGDNGISFMKDVLKEIDHLISNYESVSWYSNIRNPFINHYYKVIEKYNGTFETDGEEVRFEIPGKLGEDENKLQEKFMNLKEKKYDMAEVLIYFKDSASRDEAFRILLDHNEDVYKMDNNYGPVFSGSDRKKASERGLVIYADIFEDINLEMPDFIEDMQSLLPVDIVEYDFNPVGENIEESTSCGEGKIEESKVGDVDIICQEVKEGNPDASSEDIANKLVSVMGVSKEHALEFAEDFLKSQTLNESRDKSISIDFPIPVNDRGRVKANDAKKLLKTLYKMGVLRVGRTYFVKDSAGNETCWDLTKDTFDSFVFSCEVTEANGEEVDFYNALTFSKGRNGLTDFEWEAHKVESSKYQGSRLLESTQIDDGIILENIEFVSEDNIEYDVYDECATGSIYVDVTIRNNKTGDAVKERWIADGCRGQIVGLQVEKEYMDEDPYYSSPGLVDWDYIDWDSCEDGASYYETLSGSEEFWEEQSESNELGRISGAISKAIVEFIENGMKFRENCSSPKDRFNEALTYKYRIVLDQPEGSNYRITNSDKLKFKTEEEAQKRLDDMMKYMGDRLKSKGMGLKIEEIQPKERKKRGSATDNPLYENPFKVGDIITANVGYTQILPEFWEITGVGKSTVEVKKLKSKIVSPDNWGQSGYKIPEEGVYDKDYYGNEATTRFQVKLPKFPMYYNQSEEDYERRIKEDPMDVYYIWGQGHLFKKWNGKPQVWDTYD